MTTNKILLSVLLAIAAASAHADVTVNTTTSGKASFINVGGDGVTQIKGTRQRTDNMMGGKTQSLIIDIDGRRFVDIDAKKKSATVTPLDSIADELQKVGIGTMNATLTKTAQTKQIAGFPCTVHDIRLSLPFSPTGQTRPGHGPDHGAHRHGVPQHHGAGTRRLPGVLQGRGGLRFHLRRSARGQVAHGRGAGQGLRRAHAKDGRSGHGAGESRLHRRLGRQPDGRHVRRNSPRATSPRRSRRSMPATCPRMLSRFPPATR